MSRALSVSEAKCQSCGSSAVRILDLGSQPICNAFLKDASEFQSERRFPLRVAFCGRCFLIHLEVVPPGELVFGRSFNYLTGSTSEAVTHFGSLASEFIKKFDLKAGDAVVDIGGNDGTFLENFLGHGIKVLNVDPAPEPCRRSERRGVDAICAPFEDVVGEVRQWAGARLKLITAFNVLAHTDRIHETLEGVRQLSTTGTPIFVSQSHYFADLFEKLEWDTVYHEHARYYTVSSFDNLLWRHRLKLFDARRSPYYGGSFIALASPLWIRRSEELDSIERCEGKYRLPSTYKVLADRVSRNAAELHYLVASKKESGAHIVGIGAPMKSTTLLNYCDIGPEMLDYVTEVNPLKVGLRSPGMHIPVDRDERVFEDQPEYALILSWNVADRIMKEFRSKGYRGSFILPNPTVRAVQ